MRSRGFEVNLSGSSAAKWIVGADSTLRNRSCTVRGEGGFRVRSVLPPVAR